MTLADLPAALPQELSGAILTAGMALGCKNAELGLDGHPREGRHWGSADKRAVWSWEKDWVRDMSTLTPFSFFQVLNRQQEPCFLSELLLYKERLFESQNHGAASKPSWLCFSQASRDTPWHTTGWCGTSESPALHRASAAPYGHKSMSHLLLWPQESPSSLQWGGTWRMFPVISSKSKIEDLQAAPSRQNQSKAKICGLSSLLT